MAWDQRLVSDGSRVVFESGADADHPELARILVVDDDPHDLAALERALAAPDRILVRARSGSEALRHLEADEFAVILLDVHMPGMDGFETARVIRSRRRSVETPIIFMAAANSREAFITRGCSLGAVDYLDKPLDLEILRSKVDVFVDLFRKTRQIQRQAEDLAATTAFLHSVLEGATGYAIIALSLDGTILSWNAGARQIFGYAADEVINRANLEVLRGDRDVDRGWVRTLLESTRSGGRALTEVECRRKDGRRFIAALSVEQRVGASGQLVGYVVIAHDTTTQRKAERQRVQLIQEHVARAEAERARDRLQQLIDVLPVGMLLAETDGRISMCNVAAVTFLGRVPPASDAWAFRTLAHLRLNGTPVPRDELPLVRAVRRGEVVSGEQCLIQSPRTGDYVPALLSSAPMRDPDGTIVGGVMAFQDLSPVKELERQKDAFLAAASHDLKNPLTVVRARAQLLMRRARRLNDPELDWLVHGLHGIDIATRRLAGMVNELLDIARLQMGRPLVLDLRPTDLADLLQEVAAEMRTSTDRHDITVITPPDAMRGVWDRDRIERVLVNLVSNAIKYSPEGGPIMLAAEPEYADGQIRALIRITDHGLGIPPDEVDRVFDRFYRASNVDTRVDGAGIGLSGVRQIVEQHGGTVAVESAEGRGSTFIVRLPCSACEGGP